jgi:uncharacterized membrane protein YhaH (DUF805 family)
MNRLRIWIFICLVWFFALLNIERFHEPINISSFVYVLAMFLCLCVIIVPPMRDRTTSGILVFGLIVFIVLKYVLGYQIAGQHLPITITEGLAIFVSVLVAHRVTLSIHDFETSVVKLTSIGELDEAVDFQHVQQRMYREVRRAREYDRPLSVVSIDIPDEIDNLAMDKLIVEVQEKTRMRHLRAHLLSLIANDLNDSDIVSIRDGKFLLVLTESDKKHATEVSNRLVSRIRDFLKCDVRYGIASFPEEEVTLSGLLGRAESEHWTGEKEDQLASTESYRL